MTWNAGAASNYLASFRPFMGVEGFENVKSELGVTTLTALPALNQATAAKMAGDALNALGQIKAQQVSEAGAMDRLMAQLDYNKRTNRREGLRLAGQTLLLGLAGAAGGGATGRQQRTDPRTEMLADEAFDAQMRQYRQNRSNGSYGTFLQGLRTIG